MPDHVTKAELFEFHPRAGRMAILSESLFGVVDQAFDFDELDLGAGILHLIETHLTTRQAEAMPERWVIDSLVDCHARLWRLRHVQHGLDTMKPDAAA